MKLAKTLTRDLETMGVVLDTAARGKLLEFLELLAKWNKIYNLTAVRELEQMIPRHLLDSLAVLPYLRGQRVLDIGSGAGLPGIPLALARPDSQFVLLDSNAKKIRFITQAVHELKIANVEVVNAAVEKFQPPAKFDTLVARAFAAIPDMLSSCRHLCAPGGVVLAMKGVFPQEEIAAVGPEFGVSRVIPLHVPGLDAARHLVVIEPQPDGARA